MKTNINFSNFFWNRELGKDYKTEKYNSLENERLSALQSHDYQSVRQIEKQICKYVAAHFEVQAYVTKDEEASRAYDRKARELKSHPELFFVGAN